MTLVLFYVHEKMYPESLRVSIGGPGWAGVAFGVVWLCVFVLSIIGIVNINTHFFNNKTKEIETKIKLSDSARRERRLEYE
jgi:hypothetical protein